MSVIATLKSAGGAAGGIAIYSGAKALCLAANVQRKRRPLWRNTKKVMKKYFPHLKLGKVRFCVNCTLPANWFESPDKIDAMTFGDTIFFKGSDIQKTRPKLKLLMHELAHVNQVRRCGGELQFAAEYGQGFLAGGSYKKNPMEVEACDLVTKHGDELPAKQKKP